MKKMLKLMLTASVSAVVMLASCTEGDLPASPMPPATEDTPVQVELKLKSEKMDTRAIDENAINDINIYFFSNNINYHFYYPEYAPSFVFQILPGTYTLCVVTNVHKDMGGMTKSELIRYKYSVDDMVDDIPMTASMNVRILGAMTLPTLEDFYAVGALADELTHRFHMEERGYIDRTEVNSRLIAFARELERILDKWETHATLIA